MGFTRYIVEENNFPTESNYPILDNFSISFLLMNFNHKFANSFFFLAYEKQYADRAQLNW